MPVGTLQNVLVALIVLAAGLYLGWMIRRRLTGRAGTCCEIGARGTCPARDGESKPAPAQRFVSVEEVADRARRLRRQRGDDSGSRRT